MSEHPDPRRLTVLLVDDDAVVRQVIEQGLLNEPRLQALGIKTVRASDGKRALGQIKRELPDVAVIDLFMPKMDGFELCRALRADPDTMDLPLVVISGVFKEDDKVKQLVGEVGARFVAKPSTAAELADAILAQLPNGAVSSAQAASASGSVPIAPPPRAPMISPTAIVSGLPPRHVTLVGVPLTPPPLAVGSPAPPPTIAKENADSPAPSENEELPIPRLLMQYLDSGATGTMVLLRGRMRKEIYVARGKPVSAMSNLRHEALGTLLVAHGVLDEEQLSFLLEEMKRQGEKMGAVLVQLGWLTPDDVLRYLAAQARKRVVDSLRYSGVTIEFVPGDDFLEREIEHDLEVPKLFFLGLQKTAAPDVLVETLPREHGASRMVVRPNFERHRPVLADVFGTSVIDLLAENPRVSALLTRPDVPSVLPAVETLVLCRLAEFERAADVIPMTSVLEDAARSSMTLESLGDGGKAAAVPAPALDIDLDQVGDALAALTDDALDAPAEMGAVPSAATIDESGVVSIETLATAMPVTSPVAAASAPAERGQEQRARVLQEFLNVHARSHYQLLGVDRSASIDEIVAAYESRTRRFAPDVFSGIDLGNDAGKLEQIRNAYARAFRVLSDGKRRADYDDKQGQQHAEDQSALDAELAFGAARTALEQDDPHAALVPLRSAVRAAPDQAAYQAYLGWALWKANGDAAAAEARGHLEQALALDPDQVDAHDFLGQIAAAIGDEETARGALERALELDPTRLHCLDLLAPIHADYSEFHTTERIYKRLIRALGDRRVDLRQRLWRDLATLYETEFDDQASARIAYEMAARLCPDDAELQRKVVALNAHDLDRWKDIARALTAEWRLRPGDAATGSALVDLLLRVGKHDAATIAATAMVLRGLADGGQQALAERSAPRLLTRLSQPIEGAILGRVRHAGEDTDVETLFALLSSAGIIAPFSDAEVGLFGEAPLSEDEQPVVFRRVLDYTCEVLKVKTPQRVFPMESLGGDARLADTRPPALFVGVDLLDATDTVELGFRLGRAMSFGTAGRLAGAARSGRQLKPYLLAVMAFARRALSQGEIEVVPIVEQFENTAPALRQRLTDLGQRLGRDRGAINLSAWARALNRTATRLGLLICGDLLRVGRIVADEEGPEALDDLLEFALSLDHFDLREELGISQVV